MGRVCQISNKLLNIQLFIKHIMTEINQKSFFISMLNCMCVNKEVNHKKKLTKDIL